jgi:hypothetical protein
VVDADDATVAAHAAAVLWVDDDGATVAVTADELPRVASAAARNRVVVALTGDPDG